jgi:hypothetical protein
MPSIIHYIIEGLREDLGRLFRALRYTVAVLLGFTIICVTRVTYPRQALTRSNWGLSMAFVTDWLPGVC